MTILRGVSTIVRALSVQRRARGRLINHSWDKSMTKAFESGRFKSKQRGLTVVEYVLGAIALALIIGVAVAAFGTPLKDAVANIL